MGGPLPVWPGVLPTLPLGFTSGGKDVGVWALALVIGLLVLRRRLWILILIGWVLLLLRLLPHISSNSRPGELHHVSEAVMVRRMITTWIPNVFVQLVASFNVAGVHHRLYRNAVSPVIIINSHEDVVDGLLDPAALVTGIPEGGEFRVLLLSISGLMRHLRIQVFEIILHGSNSLAVWILVEVTSEEDGNASVLRG